jgi:hypothetical protein
MISTLSAVVVLVSAGCSVEDYRYSTKNLADIEGIHGSVRIDQNMMTCDDWSPHDLVGHNRDDKGRRIKGPEIRIWHPSIESCERAKKNKDLGSREPSDYRRKLTCEPFFEDQMGLGE